MHSEEPFKQRIKQFIDLSHFSLSLYNSNPENQIIANQFIWETIIGQFKEWHDQKLDFIVSGYMAAAYYGIVRASAFVEIITLTHIERCPSLFHQKTIANDFNQIQGSSSILNIEDTAIHIQGLDQLAWDFNNSTDEIKKLDASLLRKS